MSKWYRMNVETWQTVLVEVGDDENEDDAVAVAYSTYIASKDGEIKAVRHIEDAELESAKRHADEVLGLL